MELNGKTYEMQYLTNEETAVINAMRMGAKVQADFFNSTAVAALNHAELLSGLADAQVRPLTTPSGSRFDIYELYIGKHRISHFVDE